MKLWTIVLTCFKSDRLAKYCCFLGHILQQQKRLKYSGNMCCCLEIDILGQKKMQNKDKLITFSGFCTRKWWPIEMIYLYFEIEWVKESESNIKMLKISLQLSLNIDNLKRTFQYLTHRVHKIFKFVLFSSTLLWLLLCWQNKVERGMHCGDFFCYICHPGHYILHQT